MVLVQEAACDVTGDIIRRDKWLDAAVDGGMDELRLNALSRAAVTPPAEAFHSND